MRRILAMEAEEGRVYSARGSVSTPERVARQAPPAECLNQRHFCYSFVPR